MDTNYFTPCYSVDNLKISKERYLLETDQTLLLRQKVGWGLADMGIVVFVMIKQLLILSFLTNFLGVPVGIAGVVTTSILLFDIITDPLVGYFSDRTNSRWGRRTPWMFLGAVVLAIGVVGIFGVPTKFDLYGNLIWVSFFFVVATLGFTMVAIPYGASAGEITQIPSERSTITGFRMVFASIGILLGGAAIPILAGGSREGYFFAAIIVAPIIILTIWSSIWLTRDTPKIKLPTNKNAVQIIKLACKNTPFVILVLLYGVMTLAVALITAGLPFAAIYLILDEGDTYLSDAAANLGILSLMFVCFVVGSILSQAFWVWLSRNIGKLWSLISGLILYVILLYFIYLALPSKDVTLSAALFILAGITNGAYQQIPWAMYPDLMDITRNRTGAAIEGAFSAIWLLGQKAANAIAPGLLGLILSTSGWSETKEVVIDQSEQALSALKFSITLLPALIMTIAIIGLVFVYRQSFNKFLVDN